MEKLKWDYERFKGRFENTENLSFEKDLSWGFQWPQRNYKCSFCKKEFKSAQALGGHMNVHRRDRARMRLSPSSDFPNPKPNPNPSFSSSSSATRCLPYNLKCGSSVTAISSSPAAATDQEGDAGKNLKKGILFRVDDVAGFARRNDDPRIWKAKEFVKVDLNSSSLVQHAKEDLDLELRLGYSN